ncbi:hypothetical protein FB45DRAFT_818961, partial [Roridomyces roridus]
MHPQVYCDRPCSMHCGIDGPARSPFPELICNNTSPSDPEAAIISDTIQKARADLARVEHAIRSLVSQRQELEEVIHSHTGILLRRLPNELLSEIFLRCVDDKAPFNAAQNANWIVARVCSRWRGVALSSPNLW